MIVLIIFDVARMHKLIYRLLRYYNSVNKANKNDSLVTKSLMSGSINLLGLEFFLEHSHTRRSRKSFPGTGILESPRLLGKRQTENAHLWRHLG